MIVIANVIVAVHVHGNDTVEVIATVDESAPRQVNGSLQALGRPCALPVSSHCRHSTTELHPGFGASGTVPFTPPRDTSRDRARIAHAPGNTAYCSLIDGAASRGPKNRMLAISSVSLPPLTSRRPAMSMPQLTVAKPSPADR